MTGGWENAAVRLETLEDARGNVQLCLRYPQLEGGGGENAFWRWQALTLREQLLRRPAGILTEIQGEWQETRRDALAYSGFLELHRRAGYADVRMERHSATFLSGGRGPAGLSQLFSAGGAKRLPALCARKVEELSQMGETPFFRECGRLAAGLLRRDRYYLTGEGLAVWFPQESIAPRAAGIPTVFFPFDELAGLLRFPF